MENNFCFLFFAFLFFSFRCPHKTLCNEESAIKQNGRQVDHYPAVWNTHTYLYKSIYFKESYECRQTSRWSRLAKRQTDRQKDRPTERHNFAVDCDWGKADWSNEQCNIFVCARATVCEWMKWGNLANLTTNIKVKCWQVGRIFKVKPSRDSDGEEWSAAEMKAAVATGAGRQIMKGKADGRIKRIQYKCIYWLYTYMWVHGCICLKA